MTSDLSASSPSEEDVPTFSLWRHPKTDSLYFVLGVGTCSTNGPREGVERSVIYWSFRRRRWRYRELSEFLDGRFEEHSENG
jgi:hypothetical protein